jgi:hypothetical protein
LVLVFFLEVGNMLTSAQFLSGLNEARTPESKTNASKTIGTTDGAKFRVKTERAPLALNTPSFIDTVRASSPSVVGKSADGVGVSYSNLSGSAVAAIVEEASKPGAAGSDADSDE